MTRLRKPSQGRARCDFEKRKDLYLIGEASQLGGVSQRTLRLYDELKLIEPDLVAENNYRYYSLNTLLKIPVINYLKTVGLSLDEIAKIFSSGDFGEIKGRLKERIVECDVRQRELDEQRAIVSDWADLIDEANYVLSIRPTDVGVHFLTGDSLLCMPYHFWGNYADATINLGFTSFVAENDNVISGPVILRHSSLAECLRPPCERGECDVLVLQKALRPVADECRFERPGGAYLSTYHTGPFEEMTVAYERLARYAEERGYQLEGPAYERFVTDYWTTYDTRLFVVELLAPIVA